MSLLFYWYFRVRGWRLRKGEGSSGDEETRARFSQVRAGAQPPLMEFSLQRDRGHYPGPCQLVGTMLLSEHTLDAVLEKLVPHLEQLGRMEAIEPRSFNAFVKRLLGAVPSSSIGPCLCKCLSFTRNRMVNVEDSTEFAV